MPMLSLATVLCTSIEAPDWLEDRFVSTSVEVGGEGVVVDLDGIEGGELLVGWDDADPLHGESSRAGNPSTRRIAIRLAPPVGGTLLPAVAGTDAQGAVDPGARSRFAALADVEWQALQFTAGGNGRPIKALRRTTLAAGDECLVRTVRADADGGGALARIRRPSAADAARIELDILSLREAAAPLPGAGSARPQGATRSGSFTLFADSVWHHPSWGGFDLVTLERDRPSLALDRKRFHGEGFGVHEAEGFGFLRQIEIAERAVGDGDGVIACDWRERKAERLGGDGLQVSVAPIVVLHACGEPQPGAWCVVRDRARPLELHPALFTVETDGDGGAPLPVAARVRDEDAEVVAFTAGVRASFGRRRGTRAWTGETVVLLSESATTTVRIVPPLGRTSFVGLHVATGAALLELPANGVLRLPALGEEAVLHLGSPYRTAIHRLPLEPGADRSIAAERLVAP